MYLLGFDIGSSSVKVALINAETGLPVGTATAPSQEMPISAPQSGWAEQDPEMWWKYACQACKKLLKTHQIPKNSVAAIGIAYQMHGLVTLDRAGKPLRPSIIWCDSRAVATGNRAFEEIGSDFCREHLLNSPSNFTAAKLKWVQENEPQLFEKIDKWMLPGDYIAYKMTNEAHTTVSGLSEGIFYDFKREKISEELLKYCNFPSHIFPEITPTFGIQSQLSASAAKALGLAPNIPIAYRAGDQPNNAFSLNVLQSGEVAATAGTSGVLYGVTDALNFDPKNRVNVFAHVNHTPEARKLGILLCLNGCGILYSWLKKTLGGRSYEAMNALAAAIPIGSDGVKMLPFGNGAERMLENKELGASVSGLQFNRHGNGHLIRAAQEGIAFSLAHGLEVMQGMGMSPKTIRAGKANLFLSPIFAQTLADVTGSTIELYNTDGAQGAARGAGIGAGVFNNTAECFEGLKMLERIEPIEKNIAATKAAYQSWM
jgi:xylulokinase